MTDPMIVVSAETLRASAARLLHAAGASEEDARIAADHLVEANLRGHDSHGVGMLPLYVRASRSGTLDPRAHAVIEDCGGAMLAADGRRGLGQVVARQATAAAMERARTTGVALMALRGAFHIGRVGTYGEQAAAEGYASVHFANVVGHAAFVAPFRGSDARLGTNPFCVTIPALGGNPPVVLDFATSEIALGKVRVALQRGERVREGVLIDEGGRPTTDPGVMFPDFRGALLPFGLHKGYGLALVCELFAGVLTGGGTMNGVPPASDQALNSMLSFIFDPQRLPGAARMQEEIAAAIDHVKASPPADPSLPVLVAGEPELATRAERLANGIAVERATWEQMQAAAQSVGTTWEA